MIKIGILGGMGPQASALLYQKIIWQAEHYFHAKKNADYPYFCLINLPVPDLIVNQNDEEKTVKMAYEALYSLKNGGYTHFAIACNTMHLYAEEINQTLNLNFISMVDAVVNLCMREEYQVVSILGSKTTLKTGLYEKALLDKGIKVNKPDLANQAKLTKIILRLIAGRLSKNDLKIFKKIVKEEQQKGSQKIILGCTELPLILPLISNKKDFIDSLDVLAYQINSVFYKR